MTDPKRPDLWCPAQILSQDSADWPKDERGQRLEPVAKDSTAHLQGDLLILAVGNGRQAGGGMELCPDAGAAADASHRTETLTGVPGGWMLGDAAHEYEHKHELIRQHDQRWHSRGRACEHCGEGLGSASDRVGRKGRTWRMKRGYRAQYCSVDAAIVGLRKTWSSGLGE